MKAVPPANLVNSSNSTGKTAQVIEFRRPDDERGFRGNKSITAGAALDRKKLGFDE
jgi:hypothetical protein